MKSKTFHRRNLPHLYYREGVYFITFRLAGTIPLSVLEEFQKELNKYDKDDLDLRQKRFFKKYDDYLDNSLHGENYLINDKFACEVKICLNFPDGKDYFLICYCVMPNHVHLVFRLLKENKGISKIMQSIKRISALGCNKLLNREGRFWQDESFDRLVRSNLELYNIINYVINNPVKAGLVDDWRKWPHTYLAREYQWNETP
ncbi:MAG TPA: transposase [Ignavibacteriaceae bacterium]|nr:transposase [Ignavibacteriaceae bacterium]